MGIESFESIDALMEILKKEGASDIVQKIQDAIDSASTGTELYAGVGFEIGRVAKSKVSEMTKARAAKIRNEISELIDFTFNEPEDCFMAIDLMSIDSMIQVLKKEGALDLAREMQEAISGSSMASELYCNVGFVLKRTAQSQVSEMTKVRALKMKNEISALTKFCFEEEGELPFV